MRKLIHRTAVVALSVMLVVPAVAGVADSPLPELAPGKPTLHLYSVPGVVDALALATVFSCTSMEEAASMQVGVEVFDGNGTPVNDAVGTSLTVGPGQTVRLGTSLVAGPVSRFHAGAGRHADGRLHAHPRHVEAARVHRLPDGHRQPAAGVDGAAHAAN